MTNNFGWIVIASITCYRPSVFGLPIFQCAFLADRKEKQLSLFVRAERLKGLLVLPSSIC